MSGIFGMMYQTESLESQEQDLRKLQLWNRFYGRAGEELYMKNRISLGCCLEKLSDRSTQSTSAQNIPAQNISPLHSTPIVLHRQNQTAVLDVLLYNRKELAEKCNAPEKWSDEELLFSYIDICGLEALKDVNGDFSGAIYDGQQHTLTLFRDHMGVRPLFYYSDSSLTAFSTDIHGLLALDTVDTSINEDWIYRTCSGSYLDSLEKTEYRHIFCVKPASYITFSFQGECAVRNVFSYWQLGGRKIRLSSFEQYKEHLRELVTDAVKRRLDAVTGLVGAEFSGGLDSSVIGILIHRLGRECLYHSWSLDPEQIPYAENDERLIIEEICRQEHVSCHFTGSDTNHSLDCNMAKNLQQLGIPLAEEDLPAIRYALPPYVNTLTLSETSEYMKRNGVNVVFTGHGGDEGISHRCNPYELFYHHEYLCFLRQIWSVTKGQKRRPIRAAKKLRKVLKYDRKHFSSPFHNAFAAPELLNHSFAQKHAYDSMPLPHFAYSPMEYIQEGGSRNRLDNVSLLGAYNGVRYLAPYLDYRVIDFAVSIPRHLYLKGNQNRYLFREAFHDLMPDSLYQLRMKEDGSRKNYPKDPDWFEEFARKKEYTADKLSRNLWEPYLNFDEIAAWVKRGEPSDEERPHENSILLQLFTFAMAENTAKKAKLAADRLNS